MHHAPPAQVGTLGEQPLAALVGYAYRERWDGVLRLTERLGGEHAIGLARGGLVSLETMLVLPSVGRLLVDTGALAEDVYWRTSRALGRDDEAFADELAQTGVVHPEAVRLARAEQLARGVLRLIDGLYATTAFSLLRTPPVVSVPPVDPLPLLWEAATLHGVDAHTDRRLRALGDRPIVLSPAAGVARLRMGDAEARAAALLARHPAPLHALGTLASLPGNAWERIVAVLLLAGWIGEPDR